MQESVSKDVSSGRSSRGWLIGFGYYLVIVLPVALYLWLGHNGYRDMESDSWLSRAVTTIQIPLFLCQFGLCVMCLTGMIFFRAPKDKRPGPGWQWDPDVRLIVAYVSRGNQPATLKRASADSQATLDSLGVNYALEIVTDTEIPGEKQLHRTQGDVFYEVVPNEYQTKTGARFKARALQYLLEQRNERLDGREDADNVWILHMDEESILTPECVYGIRDHIEKYDLRRTPGAIGQGEIMYNSHRYGDNVLVTAIDAVRTGHDLGLFRLAFKTHTPWIGMHGSYVVTPASVERDITWDVGSSGSVTEDACFALTAMQRGVRFDWIEGFIREQSPFTVPDIIRQRRRWFCGLRLVAFDPALHLRTTFVLRFAVLLWGIGSLAIPLPFIYMLQKFLYGTSLLPYWVFALGTLCWGMYGSQYALGAYRNLQHSSLPLGRKILVGASSVAVWLIYIPTIVEALGTLYGLFVPVNTFYVVAKDSEEEDATPVEVLETASSEIPTSTPAGV